MQKSAGYSEDLGRSLQYRRERERRPVDIVSRLAPVAREVNEKNRDWLQSMMSEFIRERRSEDAEQIALLAEAAGKTDPELRRSVTERILSS